MTEIERLARLFQEKPELAHPIEGLTDAATVADALVRVAADHGIDVSPSEIGALMDAAIVRKGELTDDQLDDVTGGGLLAMGAFALGTLAVVLAGGTASGLIVAFRGGFIKGRG